MNLNKLFQHVSFIFFTFCLVLVAMAQVDPSPIISAPPTSNDLVEFLKHASSLHGAGALAISAAVIQGLMLAAREWLTGDKGKYLMVVLMGLSLVAAVINGLISGLSIGTVFVSAGVLTLLQTFGFQVYSQFIKKAP